MEFVDTKSMIEGITDFAEGRCKPCLICGEPTELTQEEIISSKYGCNVEKVCVNCKDAVMRMREQMYGNYEEIVQKDFSIKTNAQVS